jgi:hypothetical protein
MPSKAKLAVLQLLQDFYEESPEVFAMDDGEVCLAACQNFSAMEKQLAGLEVELHKKNVL